MAVAPATATPIPNPTMPCSHRGVLKTLSLPGRELRRGFKCGSHCASREVSNGLLQYLFVYLFGTTIPNRITQQGPCNTLESLECKTNALL